MVCDRPAAPTSYVTRLSLPERDYATLEVRVYREDARTPHRQPTHAHTHTPVLLIIYK